MAEVQLTFNEESLDRESGLYILYSRLYEGMRAANDSTPPDFVENPPLKEDGEIDTEAIAAALQEYTTILMKNSAYLYASSIIEVSGESAGGAVSGCILRSGDSMEGQLGALYGFKAGVDGHLILEVAIDENDIKKTYINGDLINQGGSVHSDCLKIGEGGIYFDDSKLLYIDQDDNFCIDYDNIKFGGSLSLSEISIGGLLITEDGITLDGNIFWHAGNSNKSDVDWAMKNASVEGNLAVKGDASIDGSITSLGGFSFSIGDRSILYTQELEERPIEVVLNADLLLEGSRSVKLGGYKVISSRRGSTDTIVSFSAPGMVMNLGDSDGEIGTKYIALQSGLYNAAGNTMIVSPYGDGNFYSSFKAGCGGTNSVAIETYLNDSEDYGVIFNKYARFGSNVGPYLSTNDIATSVKLNLPFTCVDANYNQINTILPVEFKLLSTTSQYANLSKPWSASLHMDTEAEFFVFDKQVEARSFAIDSDRYKTRLIENALFFNDGVFIEGVTDGMLHNGNSYFTNSIGSIRFASGFAGYGWAIMEDETFGGYAATVDELTVRKKMRVYELEVQKMSVTNGSLWVSDSCSGDMVEEIN